MSKYQLRYVHIISTDGDRWRSSFATKKERLTSLNAEKRWAKEKRSEAYEEESMTAIYDCGDEGYIRWVCDCASDAIAKQILKLLNKE